jgi:5-methylcytosine-specific restriction protein A
MQLRTFMSLDPRSRAAGLTHVNKLEQQIWRDYSRDLTTLNKLAVALRSLSNSPLAQQLNGSVVEEDDCPAGKLLFRLHKRLESNDKLNDMKKERARVLHCELCGFDFEKTYGSVGKGYVEIHNRLPLTHMRANRRTHLSDLILVCSNCHRMLHRQRPHSNLRITRDADKRESTKDANSREQK